MATFDPDLFARRCHALSDPTRLAIVDRLRGGERCVCDLTDLLDAAQSRLSFHLRVLREAGLLRQRRDGRWSYYELVPEAFAALAETIGGLPEGAVLAAPCCGGER